MNRAQIERAETVALMLAHRRDVAETREQLLDELEQRDENMRLARIRKAVYVEQVLKAEERRLAVEQWLIDQGVIPEGETRADVEIRPFRRVSEDEMEFADWQWDVALRCVVENDGVSGKTVPIV